MCHGQIKGSKTVRFKTENPRHANAQPYKRADKHKFDYASDYRHF